MKKYDNFCNALSNLEEIYDYEEPYTNVILTGLVGLYEICFEQSWKAMKEFLVNQGIEAVATGSPRGIIKEAYSVQLIKNEQLWLDALVDRNNVAHAYNRLIAHSIIKNAKEKYVDMFRELRNTIEKS